MSSGVTVSFCFPSWNLDVHRRSVPHSSPAAVAPASVPSWKDDLEELSGDDETAAEPSSPGGEDRSQSGRAASTSCCGEDMHSHAPATPLRLVAASASTDGSLVPCEVLLLVLAQLPLAACVSAAGVCRHWQAVVYDCDELWLELYRSLGSWTLAPHVGASLVRPSRQHSSHEHMLRATRLATGVAVRFFALRKGYEYLLEACCDALWHGVHDAVARSAAAAAVKAAALAASGGGPQRRRLSHVDELFQPAAHVNAAAVQVDDKYNAKKMSSMVARLTNANWALLFEGTAAIFSIACSDIRCQLSHQQLLDGADARPAPAAPAARAFAAGGGGALEDDFEPDMRQAALVGAAVPWGGIALWRALLGHWDAYRRWLEVVTARFGPLGARVEAERQLLDLRHTAELPHLLNKGLLAFRAQVLLSHRLRRPLQAAGVWLLVHASVDAQAWRDGCGISEEHLQILSRARRLVTELDVFDDASQAADTHTRDKLRRCFGALLLRDKKAERFGLRDRSCCL